ncbi:hypothetical protein L1887_43400 [Cichorium endivia]|nr:hypothetical protein L1887_43400 [Cichorium endivia]
MRKMALVSAFLVPVDAREVLEAPLEVRVLAIATGEGELGPALNIVSVGAELGAVVLVDHSCLEGLQLVGAHAVVKHGINVDRDAVLAELLHGGLELLARAVLGAVRRLQACILVAGMRKLAEIPGVVNVVAGAGAGTGLGGRGNPDGGDAHCRRSAWRSRRATASAFLRPACTTRKPASWCSCAHACPSAC